MASTSTEGERGGTKRLVVPGDTTQEIPDTKRPRLALNNPLKVKCLKTMINAFKKISHKITVIGGSQEKPDATKLVRVRNSISTANDIMSIISTCHNIRRQEARLLTSNLIEKSKKTEFKVTLEGDEVLLKREEALQLWDKCVLDEGFSYKLEPLEDIKWIRTIGPFMNFFSGFPLRVNEVRQGHQKFRITKNGNITAFPVSKYGLYGIHYVLLEGSSFPPGIRSRMLQCLGPMTAFLCMLRSQDKFRKKYESAVKRAMAHVPCIDDIIALTRTRNRSIHVEKICVLLAEILLIATGRQDTRMFFPVNMLVAGYDLIPESDRDKFLDFFNLTGSGGYYLYKQLCESPKKPQFTLRSSMTEEMAAQLVFHGIFGTFKENFGILSQITTMRSWFAREEMRQAFWAPKSKGKEVPISLIPYKVYSKMGCANQSELLQSVSADGSTNSTFHNIITVLTNTLAELHNQVMKNNWQLNMGTECWRDWKTLDLGKHGDELPDACFEETPGMFTGTSK